LEESINCIENICTLQGEGPSTGRRMLLLRFKKCNRICKWCDTILKMRITMESEYKLSDIQNVLDEQKCSPMISGGEPTFDTNFQSTISLLNNLKYDQYANVETNGYDLLNLIKEVNPDKPIYYIYSPKIFNEDEFNIEVSKSEKLLNIDNVYFKIVISPNDELINNFLYFLSKHDINQKVFLMPEGVTRDELIKNSPLVFDLCEEYKFNFSSRMHIIYNFI
jgi:7-carboxy-7-deazaguanine synthase